MSNLLTKAELLTLVERWIADGRRVAGPQCVNGHDSHRQYDLVQYGWLKSGDQLRLEGFIRPANSAKEYVFPRHEVLYGYQFKGKQIELVPQELPTTEQIVIGARPCDAAALAILDDVFNWDVKDELYNRRRELTTVITLACSEHDDSCFCTSVGSGPRDERGSDVLLIPIDGDKYEVRCLTEKGKKLFGDCPDFRPNENGTVPVAADYAGPPARFDLDAVGTFLARGYDQPEWASLTRRCFGCGACAYTCPTCHCFDIVDEGGANGGVRARNWDACQFTMFTMHASGHNPRGDQSVRQRQRVHHKFQIYPDKFGELLCTGCGNCSRNCPADMGVLPVLKAIATK
jgi:ferredoxin